MTDEAKNKDKILTESGNSKTIRSEGVTSTALLDINVLIKKLQQTISETSAHIMELNQLIHRQSPNPVSTHQSGEIIQSELSEYGTCWQTKRLWPPEKHNLVLRGL